MTKEEIRQLFRNEKAEYFWRFVDKKVKDPNTLPTTDHNSPFVARHPVFHHLEVSLTPQKALSSDGKPYYFGPTRVHGRTDMAKINKEYRSWPVKEIPKDYGKKKVKRKTKK